MSRDYENHCHVCLRDNARSDFNIKGVEDMTKKKLEALVDDKVVEVTKFIDYGYDKEYFAIIGDDLYRRNQQGQAPYTLLSRGGWSKEYNNGTKRE
jgi:hypothetical protein